MREFIAFFVALLTGLVFTFRDEIKAFTKKHHAPTRAVLIVIGVAIYLNIGWAIGTYYHYYIFGYEPQTFWQVVWRGGYQTFSGVVSHTLLFDQIFFMFFWTVVVGLSVPISWVVYAIHNLLWLAGAGGIAKLLGVG